MKDKGFSLIEIIITAALMSIIVAVSSANFMTVSGLKAKEAAKNIDTLISQCKLETMSRSEGRSSYMEILKSSDGKYHARYYTDSADEPRTDEVIGDGKVKITLYGADGSELDDTNCIRLAFDRSTGAFKKPSEADGRVSRSRSDAVTNLMGSRSGDNVSSIYVSSGKHTYTIELYGATGAHKYISG